MPRYLTPPLSLEDIWRDDGTKFVRVRDLCHITGWSAPTIRGYIDSGQLVPMKRAHGQKACFFFTRQHARAWLTSLGLTPHADSVVAR